MLSTAWAAPVVYLEAEIGSDLQTVQGRIRVVDGARIRLVDTQRLLPMPEQDRDLRRTFPGRPEQGWMHIEATGDQEYVFHTLMPRRHGATGLSPGVGLFAHGTWFPQPLEGGEFTDLEWVVDLTVPEDHTVVLNGHAGRSEISWSGRAQTLSLAVLPEAHIEAMESGQHSVLWIRSQPPSPRRKSRLQASLDLLDSVPQTVPTVIVECPLRRRLVRPGERQLFLSDRALRVSGGLWIHHAPVIARGILHSGLSIQGLWQRDLAATALSDASLQVPSVEARLERVSWIPEVEALLHDGRLPFYSEIFDESWSGDTVKDQLEEMVSDEVPGRVIARRLALIHGQDAVEQMAWDLSRGSTLEQAASRAGIPGWQITRWRDPAGDQDYSLSVVSHEQGWRLEIERTAPEDAPPEVIRVEVDGLPQIWVTGTGSDSHEIELGRRPRRVALDPDGIVRQEDPGNDVWPRRSSTTLAFFPYQVNLSRGRLSAAIDLVYRPQVHGRQAWRLSAGTDDQDLISGTLTWYQFSGPLRDRRTRPFRFWLGAGAAILDPVYRPIASSGGAIGTHAGVAWDTRDDFYFPLHGHRMSIYASGGWVPGADQWGAVHFKAAKILSLRGRLAHVSSIHGGVAQGGVEHRLLSLGGSSAMLSIPPGTVVGDQLLTGASELRLQVIRGASIPLPGMWLSEINLSAGVEAGQLKAELETGTQSWEAIGLTTGISFVADIAGVRPSLLGLWAGFPLQWEPVDLVDESRVQLVMRFTHPF